MNPSSPVFLVRSGVVVFSEAVAGLAGVTATGEGTCSMFGDLNNHVFVKIVCEAVIFPLTTNKFLFGNVLRPLYIWHILSVFRSARTSCTTSEDPSVRAKNLDHLYTGIHAL